MEFSVFIDVIGWARETFGNDVSVDTCGLNKAVISTFNVPIKVDVLIDEVDVSEYGVIVENNPVVVDENIITSYCPQTAPKVAFTLLEMLIGKEKTDEVRVAMGYK